jgi:MFS transporter, DHA1 family, 2-module integral membrane pump EmrD
VIVIVVELLKVKSKSNSSLLWLIYISAILLAMNYLLSSDMFVPSLPKISSDLGVTASLARMMVPFFIIALAIVQLFSGPISDKYGRRPVIIVGCIIYLIASILCLLSTNISLLLIGRILQGIGCGVLLGLSRTIIQDSLTKEEFTIAIGWVSLFFMLAGAISPVIGGLVQTYLSWRFTFGIMLVFIMLLIPLVVLYMPETHDIGNRNSNVLNIKSICLDYFEMIKHKQFMIYIYYMIVAFSGIIVFYVLGPFIFIDKYGESAQYFGFMTLGLVASAFLSRLYMNLFALTYIFHDIRINHGNAD